MAVDPREMVILELGCITSLGLLLLCHFFWLTTYVLIHLYLEIYNHAGMCIGVAGPMLLLFTEFCIYRVHILA